MYKPVTYSHPNTTLHLWAGIQMLSTCDWMVGTVLDSDWLNSVKTLGSRDEESESKQKNTYFTP